MPLRQGVGRRPHLADRPLVSPYTDLRSLGTGCGGRSGVRHCPPVARAAGLWRRLRSALATNPGP